MWYKYKSLLDLLKVILRDVIELTEPNEKYRAVGASKIFETLEKYGKTSFILFPNLFAVPYLT